LFMTAKSFSPAPPVEYAYGDMKRNKMKNKTGIHLPPNQQPKILHLPAIKMFKFSVKTLILHDDH